MRYRFWVVAALVVIALFYDGIFSWLSTCDQISGYPAADQEYKKHCSAFQGPLVSLIRFGVLRFGGLLHDYRDEIVAAFTAVLAVSTILLWTVTPDAADSAKLASQHIPTVERAYLFGTIMLIRRSSPTTDAVPIFVKN